MRRFYICNFIAFALLWANFANSETLRRCPVSFPDLAEALAQDLPSYLNRTYTKLGINQQVSLSSFADTNPLPIASSDRNLPSPNQLFVSVLSGKIGQTKVNTQPYWLFISQTNKGWRLSMAFTKVGTAPPNDVSDGAIADATRTWLRDRCR